MHRYAQLGKPVTWQYLVLLTLPTLRAYNKFTGRLCFFYNLHGHSAVFHSPTRSVLLRTYLLRLQLQHTCTYVCGTQPVFDGTPPPPRALLPVPLVPSLHPPATR